MKVSVRQRAKKDGYRTYFVINRAGRKAFADTKVDTVYPIAKMDSIGLGITMNPKEPSGKMKLKRLERYYWAIEEFIGEHPKSPLEAVKTALISIVGGRSAVTLVSVFKDYVDQGLLKESSAAIIDRTREKIESFDPDADFGIDTNWLDRFARYLKDEGASVNGIGLHLRNVRTVFNYARKKGITKDYPFLDYRIKIEKKPIKAMSAEQLKTLKHFPVEPYQREYRDMFFLLIYLAGVNIGDLLTCKGLQNGRLIYSRAKTAHPISIVVTPQAMEIINRYKGKKFLLNPCDRYKDYHGYMHKLNDGLKKIGDVEIVPDKVGKLRKKKITPVFEGMSTYVARYTFASIAAELGINRDIIAAALGHSWADVTSHYIAYSQKQIDDCVKKVCEFVSTL